MNNPFSDKSNVIRDSRDKIRYSTGQQAHYVVNSSASDVDVPEAYNKCRYAKVDVTGIIKIDYVSDNGNTRTEVMVANAGEKLLFQNITKVYRYYVGTTPCTSQVYTDAGAAVVGIKLVF